MAENFLNSVSERLVVVTGATGMVGGELVRQLLAAGARVRVAVRNSEKFFTFFPNDGSVEVFETLLTNPITLKEAFDGVDIVFNCAAQVSFRQQGDGDIIAENVDIAAHVVNACINSKVGLLVHVSSIAALGTTENGELITEKCYPENINGWSGYGVSKYYSENEVWRGSHSGLRTIIVNPSVILGEGDWSGTGSSALFGVLAAGLPFYTDGVMGYVDVRDVARAMIALAETPDAVGKRFILSAANLSYKELISAAAESVGRRAPRLRAGMGLLRFAVLADRVASGLTSRPHRFTMGVAHTATEQSRYDGSAVTKICKFRYTPIRETIKRMGAAYVSSRR